jgi:hypothetical protein
MYCSLAYDDRFFGRCLFYIATSPPFPALRQLPLTRLVVYFREFMVRVTESDLRT